MVLLKYHELFIECLADLLAAEPVLRMRNFVQHSDVAVWSIAFVWPI